MYDFDLKLTGEAFLTLKMDILIQGFARKRVI
jgi:hypothetical protein